MNKFEDEEFDLAEYQRNLQKRRKRFARIAARTYGVCMTCGNLIDKNRLIHSPFVKTCTGCQRTLENEANERR